MSINVYKWNKWMMKWGTPISGSLHFRMYTVYPMGLVVGNIVIKPGDCGAPSLQTNHDKAMWWADSTKARGWNSRCQRSYLKWWHSKIDRTTKKYALQLCNSWSICSVSSIRSVKNQTLTQTHLIVPLKKQHVLKEVPWSNYKKA